MRQRGDVRRRRRRCAVLGPGVLLRGPARASVDHDDGTRHPGGGRALRARGEHVERLEELRPALDRAVESDVCTVIDVATDPSVLSELLRMVATMGLM